MSASRDSQRPVQFGLAAFLGTFLFIPLWDLFALGYALFVGWRARGQTDDAKRASEAISIFVQPLRRIALLGIAFLIALFGFAGLQGAITQPGPFGFVITGARHYADLIPASTECCDTSSIIAPGRPVSEIMAERIPNTLILLAGASMAGMVITAGLVAVALWLHRLWARRETPGLALYSVLRLLAVRVMVAPAAGLALVAVLFLGIRYRLVPIVGLVSERSPGAGSLLDRLHHLLLPSILIALIPCLIAAQAGIRAWLDREERGLDRRRSWAILGLEIARTFYEQAGWILGLTLIVETLVAYPGVGRLLLDAMTRQDSPVLVASLAVFPAWLLVARLRATITECAQRAYLFTEGPAKVSSRRAATLVRPRPIDRLWLIFALALLVIPLVPTVRGLLQPSLAAREAAMLEGQPVVYAAPSDDHPLGTDGQGRDVQARLYEARGVTLGITLAGGLIALVTGGLWGGLCAFVKTLLRWGVVGESLADVLRVPADAAILLHPALVALAFTAGHYSFPSSGTGQGISMIGFAIGVALAPRMAWAVESLWESAPPERSLQWRLGGTLLVIFTAAMFATFQYSVLICFMGLGVQHPVASLGNMLAPHLDILGGTAVVDDARFYILATAVSGATAVFAWALYLLQDALADYFGFRRKSFLPRVLS